MYYPTKLSRVCSLRAAIVLIADYTLGDARRWHFSMKFILGLFFRLYLSYYLTQQFLGKLRFFS